MFSEIKLSEVVGGTGGVPDWIQYARVGKFSHPVYGKFALTPVELSEIKKNFDDRVRRVDISVDYYHENDKRAAGWFKEFDLRENGSELWARVEWTTNGRTMLAEKELRYFSPEFMFSYTDSETGVSYKNVAFGGGLTNRPYIKDMRPISLNEKGENMTELDQLKAEVTELKTKNIKLSEGMAAVAPAAKEAKDQLAPAKKKLEEGGVSMDDMPADEPEEQDQLKQLLSSLKQAIAMVGKLSSVNDVMMKEKNDAQQAKMLAEKEAKFTLMLTEGKVCAAQKDAYISGDIVKFTELAQPVNLTGTGASNTPTVDKTPASEQVMKLAEPLVKEKSMQLGDAISKVLSENPELRTKYEAEGQEE